MARSPKFLLHLAFQSAYLRCHIGFTDAQHFRDFLVVVPVQIEQNERLVQWVKSLYQFVKEPYFFRLILRLIDRFQKVLLTLRAMRYIQVENR